MIWYDIAVSYGGIFTIEMVHHLVTYLCNLCVSKKLSDLSYGGVGFICAARYVNNVLIYNRDGAPTLFLFK